MSLRIVFILRTPRSMSAMFKQQEACESKIVYLIRILVTRSVDACLYTINDPMNHCVRICNTAIRHYVYNFSQSIDMQI